MRENGRKRASKPRGASELSHDLTLSFRPLLFSRSCPCPHDALIQIVFFASDNGAHLEGGHNYKFFNSTGGLLGHKRSLYEVRR